jgi:spore cortex formation protein SpoVR/YcgB (stage V sporulation)
MNEGHATQIHYTILNMMYDQGYLGAGSVIEFLKSHAGVITQRDFDHKHYSGINVYALGFAMMEDIKRICTSPDEEDKRLFPQICNTNWVETVKHIVSNYRDESFIMQFLSPKIIKRFKLFTVHDDEEKNYQEILHTQDEEYVHQIRKVLAAQYDLSKRVPHLEITDVDWEGTRRLSLVHYAADGVRLNHDDAKKTAEYLHILWGHEVSIQWGDED